MIKPLKILLSILASVAVILLVWIGASLLVIKNTQVPSYKVLQEDRSFEIREYEPYVIAEAAAEGEYRDAVVRAEKNLRIYLEDVSRTPRFLPFRETTIGEKENTYLVSYILPFSILDLPKPKNQDVRLHVISKQRVAVLAFAGNPSRARIEREKRNLERMLRANEIVTYSDPIYIRFTPIFIFPFLTRNEVQVVI